MPELTFRSSFLAAVGLPNASFPCERVRCFSGLARRLPPQAA
jgi:hypothetical protein